MYTCRSGLGRVRCSVCGSAAKGRTIRDRRCGSCVRRMEMKRKGVRERDGFGEETVKKTEIERVFQRANGRKWWDGWEWREERETVRHRHGNRWSCGWLLLWSAESAHTQNIARARCGKNKNKANIYFVCPLLISWQRFFIFIIFEYRKWWSFSNYS